MPSLALVIVLYFYFGQMKMFVYLLIDANPISGGRCMYTVGHKKEPTYFSPVTVQNQRILITVELFRLTLRFFDDV